MGNEGKFKCKQQKCIINKAILSPPPLSSEISYIWLGTKQVRLSSHSGVLLRTILISVFLIVPDSQYFMTTIWSWLKKTQTIPVIHQPELSYHGRNKRTPCSSAALLSSGLRWRHALLVREMMMRIKATRFVHVNVVCAYCRRPWCKNGSD